MEFAGCDRESESYQFGPDQDGISAYTWTTDLWTGAYREDSSFDILCPLEDEVVGDDMTWTIARCSFGIEFVFWEIISLVRH